MQLTRETVMGELDIKDEFSVLKPEDSGATVAAELRRMGGGAVLVAGPDMKVLGSVTWKDIIRLVSEGGSPADIPAGQLMNSHVVMINEDERLGDVLPRIAETYASAFVVTNHEGQCVGYFSPKDYRDALAQLGCYNKKHADDDVQGWRDQAVALASSGQTDEAMAAFDRTLQLAPDRDALWFDKARVLERSGKYGEAVQCYDEVLKLNPRSHQAWYNKGNASMYMGDLNGAILAYDQALQMMPSKVEAWLNKGAAHMRMSDFRPAIQSYERALQLAPNSVEGWYNKGNCMDRVGDLKGAVECYRRAVKLEPDHENSWYNMGAALHQCNRSKNAAGCFEKVLRLNPANSAAREALAICRS